MSFYCFLLVDSVNISWKMFSGKFCQFAWGFLDSVIVYFIIINVSGVKSSEMNSEKNVADSIATFYCSKYET